MNPSMNPNLNPNMNPMDERRRLRVIEAMLFASGDPVSVESMGDALSISKDEVIRCCEALREEYEREERGMQILRLENTYQMTTRPAYYEEVRRLYRTEEKAALSETQIETLAIIAYRQPVTKQEIEDIRGVRSDAVVNRLLEYGLIMEKGRKKAPGRPILFGTTPAFLRAFQLDSLKDLPHRNEVEASYRNEEEASHRNEAEA